MRTFFSLLLAVAVLSISAQTTTTTTTQTHQTSSSDTPARNMMASNIHTNNGKVDSHSSTSETRYSYKFSADFRNYKQQNIKRTLFSHLNEEDMTVKNDAFYWKLENADGVYFTCKLSHGALSLNLNKSIAPNGSLRKVEDLCHDLVNVVSSHPNMPNQGYDPQLTQRASNGNNKAQLQQALRELEAARRKVDRLGKKIDEEHKD